MPIKDKGFSLMEVNIAVALISVGLLAVFSLFPVGLRESDLSVTDNHEAMFANHVLSCCAANAQSITSWSDWSNPTTFSGLIRRDVDPVQGDMSKTAINDGVFFPAAATDGKKMRYDLKIMGWRMWRDANGGVTWSLVENPGQGQHTYMLQLKVRSGIYGDFETYHNTYVTMVTYLGE